MEDEVGWIQTYSGEKFFPARPEAGGIHVEDIAHALSMQCRFAGHTSCFYSVAQHSIHVSDYCPRFPLHALLHDAAEAYILDFPRPIKHLLRREKCETYDRLEEGLMAAIWERFGLQAPGEEGLAEIKKADLLLLATEARDFMSPLHPDWVHCERNGWPVIPDRLPAMSPGAACWLFLKKFRELTAGREV